MLLSKAHKGDGRAIKALLLLPEKDRPDRHLPELENWEDADIMNLCSFRKWQPPPRKWAMGNWPNRDEMAAIREMVAVAHAAGTSLTHQPNDLP